MGKHMFNFSHLNLKIYYYSKELFKNQDPKLITFTEIQIGTI